MAKIYESLPTYADEVNHEKIMVEKGKHRTNKRRLQHIERGEESVTSYGKVMVRNTINPLANLIQEYLITQDDKTGGRPEIAFQHLCEVEPEISALITAKHIINTVTQQKPFTGSCIALGGKIETEVAMRSFQTLNPKLYDTVMKDLDRRPTRHYTYRRRKLREQANRDGVGWVEWSKTDKLHVGIRLVELMVQATGLIEIGHNIVKKKKTKVIKITEKTLEWIKERNAWNELLSPEYKPMVSIPLGWTSPIGGGYKDLKLDLVKQKNKRFREELASFQMPQVYEAVNNMQSTPFQINRFILDVMNYAWEKGFQYGGMPSSELPAFPNRPHDIDTNKEALLQYKIAKREVHDERAVIKSKRILFSQVLNTAKDYSEYEKIYYPLQLDFRGRVYCVPAFLNYQSVGGAKALIKFSNGKPITTENKGIFWLAVHGANCWGNDKVALADRHQWIEDNSDWIVACGKDPLGNLQWNDADSPYQFLAFCDEWARFKEEGEGFVSHIPVAVDGSCNGLQLYSLMLRDEHAGRLVNLTVTEKPEDIYQAVADNVIEQLRKDATDGKPYAQEWLNYGVTRKITKRPIMTICYGSTRYSCTDFVKDELVKAERLGKLHPFPKKKILEACTYLAKAIWASIGDNLSSARQGMDFLQAIARIICKDQLPIHWINPVGFPVWQSYPETKSMRVKAQLMGEVIKPRLNKDLDTTDRRKMVNGVAANFVHSLDSACMMETVNLAASKGITNFCNVHDSFGTTAADVHMLSITLRDAFVKIFQDDVLQDFKDGIEKLIPEKFRDKLPEVPAKGNLNLDDLRQSEFFFA